MSELRILLCCGAGISSGFLASAARKAAKKKGVDAKVEARSRTDVANYMDSVDVLLVAPHFRSELGNFQALAEPHGVAVAVIPDQVYATLDGEALFALAQDAMTKNSDK